jgi:hypothetical protein
MANPFDQFDEEDTSNPFDQFDTEEAEEEKVEEQAESKDAISTQMYEGMTFKEANDYYNSLMENPNVKKPPLGIGFAIYTDEKTGRKEYIPRPSPRMFDAAGKAIITAIQAPFSDEISLKDAADEFNNPDAKVSNFDKVAMGLGESFGATVEAGAAVAEKAGVEGAMDAVGDLVVNVDTDDSFVDTLLTDAVPAAAAAIGTGGAVAGMTVVQKAPLLIRALATTVPAEVAASLGTSTDEGTLLLGEDASLMPIAKGLDLGDEEADAVLEQRFNTMVEGMFMNSVIGGVLPAGAKIGELGMKFTLFPIYAAVVGGNAMEKRIYERIANQLIDINANSSPEQIVAARQAIAKIVDENKEVIVPMLNKLEEDKKVVLDTTSALLRGVDNPEDVARISGVRAGQIQKGSRAQQTIAASERPQAELQADMEQFLQRVGGETDQARVGAMGDAAEELAEEARGMVDDVSLTASAAQADFDSAAEEVVRRIQESDVELSGQISKLEDLTGTEIVSGQQASFEAVRDGLIDAQESMTKTKNDLYNSIPEGTEFDYQGFADAVNKAVEEINLLDTSGTRTKGIDLINTIQSVIKPKDVVEEAPFSPFGVSAPATTTKDFDGLAQEMLDGGVDFRVLYNQVRPEISTLINEAFKRGDDRVAQKLLQVKKAIDEQVEWVAENGDGEAATAAREAYDYYSGTYAPIWADGGVIERFGTLYEPVMERGVKEAEFREGSNTLLKDTLSGQNEDAVLNLKTALEQSADPAPIADYMISDVINSFASDIRGSGDVSAEVITKMSDRLRQYSGALNTAFPERAEQINGFIRAVESAAGNKQKLEEILSKATEEADNVRAAVKQSELGNFLRDTYGKEFQTTTNPEKAFVSIFRDGEAVGTIQDILNRVDELPEARRQIVKDGMEVAYFRYLNDAIKGAKMESAGSQSLKGGNVDNILKESSQMLNVGREIFSDRPEMMESITTLLEAARMIQKEKGATPVASMSPTEFNRQATTATNRLIMTFIGPLSRGGAQIRAIAGGVFDYVDPTKRAEIMLDNILADPNKFIELSRKYDTMPMDQALKENIITGLTTGFIKGYNAERTYATDQNNVDQQMNDLILK